MGKNSTDLKVAGKKEIRLTTKGLDIAKTMARRHRLLERWLTDVLGLDWSRAHDEAHRLEHALSPVVEERLAEMLGMPSTCPHGNPIPGMPQPEAHNPIPLSQATKGQALVVERITEEIWVYDPQQLAPARRTGRLRPARKVAG